MEIPSFLYDNNCMKKPVSLENITRFNPDRLQGLSTEQVNQRKEEKLVNKTKMISGKTYWEIIHTNILSFFNILLFIIAGLMIYANVMEGIPWNAGLFFIIVLISNIVIGLYQDLKAKHLMNKLKVITTPNAHVVRDGQVLEIKPEEIVLDDVLLIDSGEQIASDSIILEGEVMVNESMLTGESRNVKKHVGDTLFSGSYLTSGKCYARVDKVGKENYIETITEKARAFKRNPSHILRSLKVLFRYLGAIIVVIALISIIIYAIMGKFNTFNDFIPVIRPITGQMVAMIPAGLYLLTSFALASGVLSLHKKRAHVQDFYSIEMLARSNVICVDKTGTITDGKLTVKELKLIDNSIKVDEVSQIISTIVNKTGDNNVTAQALKEHFSISPLDVVKTLPFTSENKYSAISLASGVTYVIGALEFINVRHKEQLIKESEYFTSKGLRLLVLARGSEIIDGNSYPHVMEAIAFIALQDHVKDDAMKTFNWFNENNVEIKVISGDNAITVSEVAKSAGIIGADKYISLEGMSIEEVKKIANEYVVFGRVTPEQKEAIIMSLKANGKTVAMVGDGINDMLALKRADCSIAMNSGSLSARNVSHVVLMDDNFSTMPAVVAEGRRVINNLERTGSLFLTKTFFAIAMALIFSITIIFSNGRYGYPFSTNNMVLWEVFGIGLTSFFIALEPDAKPIKAGFLRQILKNAIPYASMISIAVVSCFLLYVFQKYGWLYTGVNDFGFNIMDTAAPRFGASGIASIVFTFLSLFVLYRVCSPLNLYRGIVVGIASGIVGLFILLAALLDSNALFSINVNFGKINAENWVAIICMIVILIASALLINTLYKNLTVKNKKENKDEN